MSEDQGGENSVPGRRRQTAPDGEAEVPASPSVNSSLTAAAGSALMRVARLLGQGRRVPCAAQRRSPQRDRDSFTYNPVTFPLASEEIAYPRAAQVRPQNASNVAEGRPLGPMKNTIWTGIMAA